jgi:hypothetical protein
MKIACPSQQPIISGYEEHPDSLVASCCWPPAYGQAPPLEHGTSVNTPNGAITAAPDLKKFGDADGSIAGPQGEVAVEGTQKDKAVIVNFSVQTPNGPIAIVINGTQDGDALAGTMDLAARPGRVDRQAAGQASAAAGVTAAASGQADKVDVTGSGVPDRSRRQYRDADGDFKQEGEKLTGTYSCSSWRAAATGTVRQQDRLGSRRRSRERSRSPIRERSRRTR